MIIKNMALELRPRERLMREGIQSVSDVELIAVLLGTGSKNRSAIDLAYEIISMDSRGTGHLIDAGVKELMRIDGIGEAKACRIAAAFELAKRAAGARGPETVSIDSPSSCVELFMEKMRYYRKEYFNVLLLDSKGNILKEENVSVGDLSTSIVNPRESFTEAVRSSAAAVIFVHNHPSGDPAPSEEDIAVTERLKKSGDILGINVLDHLIIGDGTYASLKEMGYI